MRAVYGPASRQRQASRATCASTTCATRARAIWSRARGAAHGASKRSATISATRTSASPSATRICRRTRCGRGHCPHRQSGHASRNHRRPTREAGTSGANAEAPRTWSRFGPENRLFIRRSRETPCHFTCAPTGIRTQNLRLRRPVHYPVVLWVLGCNSTSFQAVRPSAQCSFASMNRWKLCQTRFQGGRVNRNLWLFPSPF
jgi:hypothetical protein